MLAAKFHFMKLNYIRLQLPAGNLAGASQFRLQGKFSSPKANIADSLPLPKKEDAEASSFFGTLEGTRTPDLLVRSQSLYPTELPAHNASLNAL